MEDSWKVNRKLTLNYGLRWDDFGNPYSRTPSTAFGNFFLGPGANLQTQIANGSVVEHHHALNRSITDVFSPRIGAAWDPTGDGKWVVKGGFGFFHNWPTLANLQEQYRGNPPGNIFPTFQTGTSSPAPIFSLGTSNNKPFGFTYPTLPARPLNSTGRNHSDCSLRLAESIRILSRLSLIPIPQLWIVRSAEIWLPRRSIAAPMAGIFYRAAARSSASATDRTSMSCLAT